MQQFFVFGLVLEQTENFMFHENFKANEDLLSDRRSRKTLLSSLDNLVSSSMTRKRSNPLCKLQVTACRVTYYHAEISYTGSPLRGPSAGKSQFAGWVPISSFKSVYFVKMHLLLCFSPVSVFLL